MSTESRRISFSRQHLPVVLGKAYDLSKPQGMGFLHARPGPLLPEELNSLAQSVPERCGIDRQGISLDYVLGRAVKLLVLYDDTNDSFYLVDDGRGWYDHSDEQWEALKATAQEGAA